jgi:hypothetical protein
MQCKSLIHRWRLIALGTVLCLLAAAFAFEAKIAWYSSAAADTHISAAKLQPTKAPRLVAQALIKQAAGPRADLAPLISQFAWFVVFASLAAASIHIRRFDFDLIQAHMVPGVSPSRFSRPPPAL